MAICLLMGCLAYKRCNSCPKSKKGNEEGRKKYSWWGDSQDCQYEAGVREADEVIEETDDEAGWRKVI